LVERSAAGKHPRIGHPQRLRRRARRRTRRQRCLASAACERDQGGRNSRWPQRRRI